MLGGAAALLHLIDFDEPFGFSVVEAMACGTPVIAYRRGSMPELIDDGATGFLVDDVARPSTRWQRAGALDRPRSAQRRRPIRPRPHDRRVPDPYGKVIGRSPREHIAVGPELR